MVWYLHFNKPGESGREITVIFFDPIVLSDYLFEKKDQGRVSLLFSITAKGDQIGN